MLDRLRRLLATHRTLFCDLLLRLVSGDRPLLLNTELVDELERFIDTEEGAPLAGTVVEELFTATREAVIEGPFVCVAVRPRIGQWLYLRLDPQMAEIDQLSVSDFLRTKERMVNGGDVDRWELEVDLGPFNRDLPTLREPRFIGSGVEFLNRHLTRQMFRDRDKGFEKFLTFLRLHQCDGQQLMLNDRVLGLESLSEALDAGLDLLEREPDDTEWADLALQLQPLGFEPGWGRSAASIRDSFTMLMSILEAPDPAILARFLSRMPMVFRIAIISPHGFFGQAGVLGLPDTGGQVVYILDQVRALEREMRLRIHQWGLDIEPQIVVVTRLLPESRGTSCDQRLEQVHGTRNARILRVPFRASSGEVLREWVSRFEIWPYLETFARDAGRELLAELGARPDFVVGNYSDGNLVAALLCHELGVTQCNVAHALEKTKYLFSDLYWRDNEDRYHFSCQFTADLIAMNAADFIISSTYQEIAGTPNGEGQYESYRAFTMPGLYRVVDGVNVFDPKFNIVSPGAAPEVYFPHTASDQRMTGLRAEVEDMLFGHDREPVRGRLAVPDKPIIFTMSRLDHIKNITGLVEWFGASAELRELANVVVVGGFIDPDLSEDREERHQIELMHELMDRFELDDCLRWLPRCTDRQVGGELYRVVADHRGVFVQPARFEAFGLTVVEAMTSGLPTFATRYGGPQEIIVHGVSGFHIDPNRGGDVAGQLVEFFASCRQDPAVWERISSGAVERVASRYTWELYARRLLDLSNIYGFWRYATDLERRETRRYLEMFYALQYRPLAEALG